MLRPVRFHAEPSIASRRARLATAAVVFLLAFTFAALASAQSIEIVNPTSLPRYDAEGNQLAKREITLTPEGVSLQDCVDDQRIRFTLLMSGFQGNASVQAWASVQGNDCKTQTSRQGGTQVCWDLLTGIPSSRRSTSTSPCGTS